MIHDPATGPAAISRTSCPIGNHVQIDRGTIGTTSIGPAAGGKVTAPPSTASTSPHCIPNPAPPRSKDPTEEERAMPRPYANNS